MKSGLLSIILVLLAFVPLHAAADYDWCSLSQVEEIVLSVQVADYPLPQGQLKSVIGNRRLPHLGVSSPGRGKPSGVVALTDPQSPNGYFAVRIFYDLKDPLPKPEEIPLEALQVLFVAKGLSFVYEPEPWLTRDLPNLKMMMKKGAMTPIVFAEFFYRGPKGETEPNQAPLPTPMSVTPPAGQEARQP